MKGSTFEQVPSLDRQPGRCAGWAMRR